MQQKSTYITDHWIHTLTRNTIHLCKTVAIQVLSSSCNWYSLQQMQCKQYEGMPVSIWSVLCKPPITAFKLFCFKFTEIVNLGKAVDSVSRNFSRKQTLTNTFPTLNRGSQFISCGLYNILKHTKLDKLGYLYFRTV